VSAQDGSRIKSAAAALLKGGTLVSDQCPKCGGVQVKFADKVTCINCGNESGPADKQDKPSPASPPPPQQQQAGNLGSAAAAIEAKISAVASELEGERDSSVQKQKAELLETYLRILEKMRELGRPQ
jgi:uncharacterized Zn finger protein (UPF0148 family)